jgi:hypothetical protein
MKMQTRVELEALSEEELDEIVHDLKGEEAAAINNSGKDEQIAYILGTDETDTGCIFATLCPRCTHRENCAVREVGPDAIAELGPAPLQLRALLSAMATADFVPDPYGLRIETTATDCESFEAARRPATLVMDKMGCIHAWPGEHSLSRVDTYRIVDEERNEAPVYLQADAEVRRLIDLLPQEQAEDLMGGWTVHAHLPVELFALEPEGR